MISGTAYERRELLIGVVRVCRLEDLIVTKFALQSQSCPMVVA
jgi:hypothetical protein